MISFKIQQRLLAWVNRKAREVERLTEIQGDK